MIKFRHLSYSLCFPILKENLLLSQDTTPWWHHCVIPQVLFGEDEQMAFSDCCMTGMTDLAAPSNPAANHSSVGMLHHQIHKNPCTSVLSLFPWLQNSM